MAGRGLPEKTAPTPGGTGMVLVLSGPNRMFSGNLTRTSRTHTRFHTHQVGRTPDESGRCRCGLSASVSASELIPPTTLG